MAKEAVTKAVKDANVSYKDVEQAFVGYVYGRRNLLAKKKNTRTLSISFFRR
jgi:hypothetical protein